LLYVGSFLVGLAAAAIMLTFRPVPRLPEIATRANFGSVSAG
jgi:hypothetical protein